jgi:hypothetical protein
MFETIGVINHSLNQMALALTITFIVPLIGGIAGTILTNLTALHKEGKKMKRNHLRKMATGLAVIFVVLVCYCSEAFSWGSATHAYINDQLNKKSAQINNEIYGGVAPDLFSYMFDSPFLQDLDAQTHDQSMKVWKSARSASEKALAYGFVSHNDLWGADSTAHHSGRTFGTEEGYVISKAYQLKSALETIPEYAALELPEPISLEVSHNFVETGLDILTKRLDPQIGGKLSSAATRRSPILPAPLVRAYAKDLSLLPEMNHGKATRLIQSAEKEFRKSMILYGQALMLDDATAIQLIAEQTADISRGFLSAYGIPLPEEIDLIPLITFAIEQSITLCADDFDEEIAATIDYVDQNLQAHGIGD